MRVFDLHCDTLYEMYIRKLSPESPELHISLPRAAGYERYDQVFGIWSDIKLSPDEAYEQYLAITDMYRNLRFDKYPNFHPHLGVEGARLLNCDMSRLDRLQKDGVRILTLAWRDSDCIGEAFNCTGGLTEFGKAVVLGCFDRGIVPDVSHASDRMFEEVAELAAAAGKPFIASHSCSRALCRHPRNLTDEMFKAVAASGGLVGVSFYALHVNESGKAGIKDVADHIIHYLSLGGEKTVCLGGDFDGCNDLPEGLTSISDEGGIADALLRAGVSRETVNGVMYENAASFFDKQFGIKE